MSRENSPVLRSAGVYGQALGNGGGRLIDAASGLNGADMYVALYECTPYDLKVAPMIVPRLSINLRSVAVSGALGGARVRDYAGKRQSLFFTPAHTEAAWLKRAPSRHLNIYFHPRMLEEAADGDRGAMRLDRPLFDVQLPALRPWIDALELSIARAEPYAEDASMGLAHLILATLARRPDRALPGLAPGVLNRVQDYVAAHLHAPITVADLAAAAGLAPSRFALQFNAATGSTPHRYVLCRRIERAQQLLRDGRPNTAEVAIDCGFSSQQHMTSAMRRLAGVTPGQVRRAATRETSAMRMAPAWPLRKEPAAPVAQAEFEQHAAD